MRFFTARWGRVAQRDRRIKVAQSLHLPIEPISCTWPMPIRPANTGSELSYVQPLQPLYREVQPWVLELKPLAYSHAAIEGLRGRFGNPVSTEQAHVKVAVVIAAFILTPF